MNFHLLDEPWLPATDTKGNATAVGLLSVFSRAHQLKQLDLESPDVIAAVFRMLLVILHRAYEGPKSLDDWKAIWDRGAFDANRVNAYLEKWRSRFDVWDPKHPFLQDPEAEGEENPLSRLFAEQATGNNATLFDHSIDDAVQVVSTASAIRRLLGAQHFALGGRTAGSAASAKANPLAAPTTFLLRGSTVFELLMLNLLVYDRQRPVPSTSKDSPSWERQLATEARQPEGYLDLMTWRPRRYRLIAGDETGRTCRAIVPAGEADRFEATEDGDFRDPLASYRTSKEQGYLPLRVDPERALWRDSLPFFAGDSDQGRRPMALEQAATLIRDGVLPRTALLNLMAVGFATDQAKVLLGRLEVLPVPAALLATPGVVTVIRDGIERASDADRAVNGAAFVAAQSALSAGERKPDTTETSALAGSTGARSVYWGQAGLAFPGFLTRVATDPESAAAWWEAQLKRAALEGFERVARKLGTSARGLRAVTRGSQHLRAQLREAFPESTPTQPEVTT